MDTQTKILYYVKVVETYEYTGRLAMIQRMKVLLSDI